MKQRYRKNITQLGVSAVVLVALLHFSTYLLNKSEESHEIVFFSKDFTARVKALETVITNAENTHKLFLATGGKEHLIKTQNSLSQFEKELNELEKFAQKESTQLLNMSELKPIIIKFRDAIFDEMNSYNLSNFSRNPRIIDVDNRDQEQFNLIKKLLNDISEQEVFLSEARQAVLKEHDHMTHVVIIWSEIITIGLFIFSFILVNREFIQRLEYQKELITLQRQAEDASRMKSQFLINMSHEVRTPLNGVLGMAQLMGQTQMSFEQKEYLESILKSGRSLLLIINEILDFSKVESGRPDIEIEPFDFYQVVDELKQTFQWETKKKNLFFKVNIDSQIPGRLLGDDLRIKQVLSQLIKNAIKFTAKGGIDLSISLVQAQVTDIRIKFSVKDTGVGIDPSSAERIFEPFSQEDSRMNRRFGGTGLGLSIAQRWVQAMKGNLEVESQVGKGAHFWFEITLQKDHSWRSENYLEARKDGELPQEIRKSPLTGRDTETEKTTQMLNSPLSQLEIKVPSLNILVVEDNELNQRVASLTLEKLGHKVIVKSNGNQALEILEKCRFDLIFMDCQMPEMDGFACTKMIREHDDQRIRNTRIIAMTAHAVEGDRQRCLRVGMDDYISKPFTITQLREIILKWFGNRIEYRSAHEFVQNEQPTTSPKEMFQAEKWHQNLERKRSPSLDASSSSLDASRGLEGSEVPKDSDASNYSLSNIEQDLSKIDPERLEMLKGLPSDRCENLSQELIQLYLESTPSVVAKMNQLISDNNMEEGKKLEQVRRIAHSLKSSSGNLGLVAIQKLCQKLEDLEDEPSASAFGYQKLVEEINVEYKIALPFLRKEAKISQRAI